MHGVTWTIQGALYQMRTFNHSRTTEIRDLCMINGIHEDIRLDARQHGGKTWLRVITYSLEIATNYVAGVEIIKAISDVRQLVAEISMGPNTTAGTHTR